MLRTLLLLAPIFAVSPQDEGAPSKSDGSVVLNRGPESIAIVIPEKEILEYRVILNVAVIGATDVGDFTLSAGTDVYRPGLPASGVTASGDERIAWIRAHAAGSYLGYRMDHEITARHLPKEWPATVYRATQRGSENRRRELMYGVREGEPSAWYRSDRHCKKCKRREHFVEGGLFSGERHCKKCKRGEHRVWKKPVTRKIPARSVDMLTSIHLARSIVRDDIKEVRYVMLDKAKEWDVTLTRVARKKIKTPAGEFWCRAVKLDPQAPKDEEREEKFKGLFGIHGTLSIWLEERTGVPIVIEGVVPIGPFDVDIELQLKKAKGVPPEFGPAK
ncbi:MAG: DUF3108 domain-containing protein [bacterium]|nr:DUF3108 domain-containing protein [bacterium]